MIVYRQVSFKYAIVFGFALGIIIYTYDYKRHGKLTNMDKLGMFGLLVQSVLGIFAENPKIYFIYPLLENCVFAGIFLGSLFTKEPLAALFAKDYVDNDDAFEILRSCYRRITIWWGLYYIVKAFIKVLGLMSWSFEVLYSVNWILGTPVAMALLWLSFHYPNQEYQRLISKDKQSEPNG
jgi:intracellular septation protein A